MDSGNPDDYIDPITHIFSFPTKLNSLTKNKPHTFHSIFETLYTVSPSQLHACPKQTALPSLVQYRRSYQCKTNLSMNSLEEKNLSKLTLEPTPIIT